MLCALLAVGVLIAVLLSAGKDPARPDRRVDLDQTFTGPAPTGVQEGPDGSVRLLLGQGDQEGPTPAQAVAPRGGAFAAPVALGDFDRELRDEARRPTAPACAWCRAAAAPSPGPSPSPRCSA